MPTKKHDREYDLVLLGATGYTGKWTAEAITRSLPSNLKWAVAGRSSDKLHKVVSECKSLNPDRTQPEVEICSLEDEGLSTLAKKTVVLISTVGPYGKYGEPVFKACAGHGTHYIDVTGEVPFVARMIAKYEGLAKATGAMLIPQCGVESSPADLIAWSLAKVVRDEFSVGTRDVVVSVHELKSVASGGTLSTALSMLQNYSLVELRDSMKPFGLSPIANPAATKTRAKSLFQRITGLVSYPNLGLLTTSLASVTDAPVVERTWGLLASIPSRKAQFYGPRFSFKEHARPANFLAGIAAHWGINLLILVLITPPLVTLIKWFSYQPGEGPTREEAAKEFVEYRGIARPDSPDHADKQAFCAVSFRGSMYHLTSVLVAQAAATLLEDDLQLPGGVFTPACLGDGFIDRLGKAGVTFETKVLTL